MNLGSRRRRSRALAHPDYQPRHCGCGSCRLRDAVRAMAAERVSVRRGWIG